MSNLFRAEVMEKQSQRQLGDVYLSTPLSFWVISSLIAIIVTGLVIVSIFGEYARKERVVGILVPTKGLVQIIPRQSGVFEKIFVSSGDIVNANTPLFKIKNNTALSNGNLVSEALLAQMKIEKDDFISQLQTVSVRNSFLKARLETKKIELLSEVERSIVQVNTQDRAVELEKGIFDRLQKLFNDEAASTLEVTSQEIRYISAQKNLNALIDKRKKLLGEIKDIEAQIVLLPYEQLQAESIIKNKINAVEQNVISANANHNIIISSPVRGRVANVIARTGQAVNAKPVMSILPEGGRLQVELYVPSRAAGFVKRGQTVRLLYDAFPYQKFGFFEGQIVHVSKSVVDTANIVNAPQLANPVFLVTVTIDEQNVDIRDEKFPLQAGMTLSADLILEERKIWEWVFEPLLGAAR